jgi:hypothetical protein
MKFTKEVNAVITAVDRAAANFRYAERHNQRIDLSVEEERLWEAEAERYGLAYHDAVVNLFAVMGWPMAEFVSKDGVS